MEQKLDQHVCRHSFQLPERSPCESRRHMIVRSGNDVFDVDLEGLEDFDVDSADYIGKVGHIELKIRAVKPPFPTSVTGISKCCNGLFLVVGEPLVIWNPFTGEFKSLPGSEDDGIAVPAGGFSNTAYGFAYDGKNDDYKVVKVVNCWDNTRAVWIPSRGHIYSLKSNKWSRTAENFSYPVKQWCGDISRVLHTFQYTSPEVTDKTTIKAFNVESEKHYEVALPLGILKGKHVGMALHKIDGWLSLICASKSETEIWVMLDYEKKYWWNMLSFKVCSHEPQAVVDMGSMKPITGTNDGSKVMYHTGRINLFAWHEFEKGYFQSIILEKDLPWDLDYVEAYVENLVSLDGEKQVQKQGQKHDDQDKKQVKKNNGKKSDDSFSWMSGTLKF